jgi:chromosome segregation ATPase
MDERVRRSEQQQEDIKSGTEGARRRQQDDLEHVRKVAQEQQALHHEADKLRMESEALKAELVRFRSEAQENRSKLSAESDLIRRFQFEQGEDRNMLARVREEVRLERDAWTKELQREREIRARALAVETEARHQLESANAAQAEALRAAQRAAGDAKRSVEELKREKDTDIGNLNAAVTAASEQNSARVEDLEFQMKSSYVDALRRMSMPDRIMYYQTLHSQAGVKPLTSGFEAGAQQHALELRRRSILEFSNPSFPAALIDGKEAPYPLMRRIQ